MAIAVLDAWATQTTTEDLSFSVSAGTDRLLVVSVGCEDGSACNVTDMLYGGQQMFLLNDGTIDCKGSATGGGSDTFLELWACLEAEIDAAVGTTIDVTMDNGSISEYLICAGSYENVDQSGNGAAGSVDFVQTGTTTNTAYSLTNNTVSTDGLAVFMGISRANSTFTLTSPLVEIVDFTTGGASVGGGDDLITADSSTYTAAMTATSNNRGVELFVSFVGGAVNPTADASITFDSIGLSSDGSLLASGDADITLEGLSLSSDTSLAGLASANILLDGLTLVSDGDVVTTIAGNLNSVFDDLTLSSDIAVLIQGDASNTLEDLSLSSDAESEIQGIADNTLDGLVLDSSVETEITAALDTTFEGLFLSSDAALSSEADSSIILDDLSLESDGTVAEGPQADLDVVFDDIILSADADTTLSADADIAFESLGLSSDVTVLDVIQANLDTTFNNLSLSSDASGDISASAIFTLGDLSLVGEVSIDLDANLSITFDSLSLVSSGGEEITDPFKIILSGKIDGVLSLAGLISDDIVLSGVIDKPSLDGEIEKTKLTGVIDSIIILEGGG